ncbi:MAG: dihydrofolate reductase family protein [Chloroflexi bacterium]|nr:dihydrofolate reductase family protein [Chloroflexota bacterium]
MPKPDYTELDLGPVPQDRPIIMVNMVASLDGKVVVEGTEKGLGSKVDQRLMRELRVNADLVLNGAGTLRASGTSARLGDEELEALRVAHGKPRLPTAVVLSRSGALPLDRTFFTATDFDAIVYLSDAAPADNRRALLATSRPIVLVPDGHELEVMLAHMRHELGAGVLLVEGGPDTNAHLFEADAVDHWFMTLGPVIVGGRDTKTAVEGARAFTRDELRRFALVSAVPNEDTSEVYLHYRRAR